MGGREVKPKQHKTGPKKGPKLADVAHIQGSVMGHDDGHDMGHDDGSCLRKRQGQRLHTHKKKSYEQLNKKTRKAKRKARTEVTGEENVES